MNMVLTPTPPKNFRRMVINVINNVNKSKPTVFIK